MEKLLVEHEDGVPWERAGVPPRRHECWPQTRYVALEGDRAMRVWRCPCGAVRLGDGPWMNKNLEAPRTRTTQRPGTTSTAA